jgi:hypothetical protein
MGGGERGLFSPKRLGGFVYPIGVGYLIMNIPNQTPGIVPALRNTKFLLKSGALEAMVGYPLHPQS